MLNQILRTLRYYLDIAMTKPLYAVVPALIAIALGGYAIATMNRLYQSDSLMLVQFQTIPTSLVSPTVSNDRLQFIEQRVLSRKNLLEIGNKYDLLPQEGNLSKGQLAGLIRQQILLDIQFSEGPDRNVTNGTVRIAFRHADPVIAHRVASDLVSGIVEENRRLRMTSATQATRFLTREVNAATAHLENRKIEWTSYLEKNKASHPARLPAVMIELQASEQELLLIERTLATLDEEIRLYETQLRLNAEQDTPTSRLTAQLAEVETEYATTSLVYSPEHPQSRALKQRLDHIKSQIETASAASNGSGAKKDGVSLPAELIMIAERLAGAKPQREQSMLRKTALVGRMTELRRIIAAAPEVEAQIAANDAEKATLQRTVDDMQAKLDTARLGERLETGDTGLQIEVVEEPELPIAPSGPRRAHLALIVLILAGLAGSAGVFAAHLFDRTVRGTFDLADMLAGSTLVVVRDWDPEPRATSRFPRNLIARFAPP